MNETIRYEVNILVKTFFKLDSQAGADTRRLVFAISRRDLLFWSQAIGSILFRAMPFYHRVYCPGELQFITTSTYRRTPLFRSNRFRRCFGQKTRGPWTAGPRYELEEVRQELHFLLIGWVLTEPGDAWAREFPRRLAVVKLEVLLLARCVYSPHGSDALRSTKNRVPQRLSSAEVGAVCLPPRFLT
ncbi:MAG: hypothetical protein ACLQVL_14035 [Terriglobia bacterium]